MNSAYIRRYCTQAYLWETGWLLDPRISDVKINVLSSDSGWGRCIKSILSEADSWNMYCSWNAQNCRRNTSSIFNCYFFCKKCVRKSTFQSGFIRRDVIWVTITSRLNTNTMENLDRSSTVLQPTCTRCQKSKFFFKPLFCLRRYF